jgi:hypothetical protein
VIILTFLISIEKAKSEIERLQHYIDLIENYQPDTLDKFIVLSYAKTNSIDKTFELVWEHGYTLNQRPIERDYIVKVLNQIGKDELHKLVRSAYMAKTKVHRSKARNKRDYDYYDL